MKTKYLTARDVNFSGKKVLIRGDLDVDDGDNPRVNSLINILNFILPQHPSKIKVIGHRETNFDICALLKTKFPQVEFDDQIRQFDGEKENDLEFAEALADDWEVYVNEAFATSHRLNASIVALPKVMRAMQREICLGLRFAQELEYLSKVWEKPGKRVLVIGGVKIKDKQKFADHMSDKFIYILKGGLLPGVDLRPDGLDISDKAIAEYKQKISEAEVILSAGVMGKYEDQDAAKGTKEILEAIASSNAYKVAGGGDIEMAISSYGLADKFDWISVGGGAMLEYLGSGTLVGLEAVC